MQVILNGTLESIKTEMREFLGVEEPRLDAINRQVLHLVKQGQIIEAIKIYRQEMNVGLKEAKDAIDKLRGF